MITGKVNADLEAIISMTIYDRNGKIHPQEAVIDTGFNGWLSLPPDLITQFNLQWKRRGRALLGDGSECVFDIYEAMILWDGLLLRIPIDEADAEPLVGMSLMAGYQLSMEIFERGNVELNKINSV